MPESAGGQNQEGQERHHADARIQSTTFETPSTLSSLSLRQAAGQRQVHTVEGGEDSDYYLVNKTDSSSVAALKNHRASTSGKGGTPYAGRTHDDRKSELCAVQAWWSWQWSGCLVRSHLGKFKAMLSACRRPVITVPTAALRHTRRSRCSYSHDEP